MIALLLIFQAMPAWAEAAHAQPVELHAQFIPVIRRQLQHIRAGEMRGVRERAHSARHWLPRFPATQAIPAGYSAYLAAFDRPVSGLQILVEALRADAYLFPPERRRILDEIPIQLPAQPTCREPIVEWLKPLFDMLAEDAGMLYPGREAKLAALERWGAWVESPFDLLGFVGFARALTLPEPEDRMRAAGLVAGILTRAPAPPCGMSFLLMPVNMRGAVLEAIEAFGQAPMILAAYRQFVARTLAAPVCRATPEEAELRGVLAADFNARLERWPAEGVAKLEPSEIARLAAGRRQIDGQPESFEAPAHVEAARSALLVAPSQETWNRFMEAWSDWPPERLGGDLRHEDRRLERLLALELPAAQRPAHAEAALAALSSSRLRTEEPGLWTAVALEFLIRLKTSFPRREAPADPALALLWGLAAGRY